MDKTMRLTTMISWALALMAALVFFAVAQSSVAEAQTATATASPQASDDGNNGGNGGRGGQGGNGGDGGDANKAGGDDGGNFSQSNEQNRVVQDSICTNVEQAASNQYKADDQAAGAQADDVIGDENSAAKDANIANALGITKRQVDACLNEVDVEASSSAASSSAASVSATPTATVATGGGSASAAAGGTLPATGGGSTSALSVGMAALLIAGGLLARRIVR
jgi:LPXTG-motif cell wall-anchored protein